MLEFVRQVSQKLARANELDHLRLSFLLIKYTKVDVQRAELRQFHSFLDENFLPLTECVAAAQSICYCFNLPHLDYM